jgi:hypothetical protein
MIIAYRDLAERWQRRRDDLARLRALVDGATLCDEFLASLEDCEREVGNSTITLAEAARISGYSAEHLARLVRSGTIPNRGRKFSPRVSASDLPRRIRNVVREREREYDAVTDARSLKARR